jgi:hypothetical protein
MFSWGNSRKHQVEELFEKAKRDTERQYAPINKVAMAILQAATNSRDNAKQWIQAPTEEKRMEKEILVFFEFVYFYMHVTVREAVTALSVPQKQKLLEYLEQLIPPVAIDSYCAHWPTALKEKMVSEFIEKQCDAEGEYTELIKKSKPEEGFLNTFILLARHIVDLCEIEAPPEVGMALVSSTIGEWEKMGMDALMAEVNSAG